MMTTINLAGLVAFGIMGLIVVFYLIDVGKKKQKLKELEAKAEATSKITKEVLKEREPGETEKDLNNGTF